MRKITELSHGNFTAKIYRDSEYNEYRVKFFHAGSHLPDGDYFTDDESDARGTAALCMQHMDDAAKRETADEDKKVYRIVSYDMEGNTCGIIEKAYPSDMLWQDCRDDLLALESGRYWWRVDFERVTNPDDIAQHFECINRNRIY